MLKALYQKISSLFASSQLSAAQIWQATGKQASHAFWMCAAPVNMQMGRDSYFLTDPVSVVLSQQENGSLIESLNTHFSGLGYHFYLVDNVWLLGLDQDPQITVAHIKNVINQDIANYLPQGEGALVWNQLQNEIQMLLFNHPVNQAREAVGQPIVNSLWCYGLCKSL